MIVRLRPLGHEVVSGPDLGLRRDMTVAERSAGGALIESE